MGISYMKCAKIIYRYIPQSIVKLAMVNQPLCIDGIRKIIEREVSKYNIPPPVTEVPAAPASPAVPVSANTSIVAALTKSEEENKSEQRVEEAMQTTVAASTSEGETSEESESRSTIRTESQPAMSEQDIQIEESIATSKILHTGIYVYLLIKDSLIKIINYGKLLV
jgi:hypothetical protein